MNVLTSWLWFLILLLVGAVLYGTVGVTEVVTVGGTSSRSMTVEIDGNPGVILDASNYRPDADGWSPSADHLQAAEDAVLVVALADDREPMLGGYRQYVGVVEDGERKVIINSMCKHFDGWDKTYIEIMDGGPCFWNAVYNVESGEVESLVVNGQA